MRIIRIGNKIRLTMTNEEKELITERNSLDVDIGLLRVLFDDISKIIVEMLPSIKIRKKK
jgi:hypothetical protein